MSPADRAGSRSTRRNGLKANTAFAVAPQVTSVLVALLLSPYIVAQVGLTAFGFWSVVLAILAFAQVADGGFPILAARHVARSHETGDDDGVRATILLTSCTLAALAVVVVAATVIAIVACPGSVSRDLPGGWQVASLCGAAAFGMTTFGKGLAAVSHGFHRWSVELYVTPASQILGAISTIVFLSSGLGLKGLGYAALVTGATLVVGYGASAHQLVGLRPRGARPTRELWRDFRKQGINLQIVSFVGATNAQSDRLMLLAFAPLSWVGAYALGSRMAVSIRAFPAAAFSPLIAHMSAVEKSDGLQGVTPVYERAIGIVIGYGVSSLFVIYGAIYAGVLAWLGADFGIAAGAATLLGIGYAINMATGPATGTAIACGRAELDRDYSVLGLAVNISLSILLGLLFGPWGVVSATTIGLSLSSGWLLFRVDRWLGVSWIGAVKTTGAGWRNLLWGTAVGATCVGVAAAVAPATRLENFAIAAIGGSVGIAAIGRTETTRWLRSRRSATAAAPADV